MPNNQSPIPLVGVLACQKHRDNGSTYSRVNDLLTGQLIEYGQVAAVLISPAHPESVANVLPRLDGLVLPGSGSFVHPQGYAPHAGSIPGREYDPARDETAMELLRQTNEIPDFPVLASCRGMQELAIHHGGRLGEISASSVNHRFTMSEDVPDRWVPAHLIDIRPNGVLASLIEPTADHSAAVNSQHTDRVASVPEGVRIEAVAPDNVIEAISVGWPHRFVLGIQWHFEQRADQSPLSRQILAAFGQHCRARMERRSIP